MSSFRKSSRALLSAPALLLLTAACTGVPDHVVQPDVMAELLADLNVAESAVDMNHGQYTSDSSRQAVKQAVLARYGVSTEMLDTSFMWYGAHIDKLMDIYDHSAEILQDRLDKNDAMAANMAALSVSGDSVDVWSASRRYMFTPRSSSQTVAFSYDADENWEKGDDYTWRVKMIGPSANAMFTIVAAYADGATEVLNTSVNNEGWQETRFFTDSTKTVRRLYGLLSIDRPSGAALFLDSMQLVRKRLDRERYSQRYRQRMYDPADKARRAQDHLSGPAPGGPGSQNGPGSSSPSESSPGGPHRPSGISSSSPAAVPSSSPRPHATRSVTQGMH